MLAKKVRSSYRVQPPGTGKVKQQKLKRDTRACQNWPALRM